LDRSMRIEIETYRNRLDFSVEIWIFMFLNGPFEVFFN